MVWVWLLMLAWVGVLALALWQRGRISIAFSSFMLALFGGAALWGVLDVRNLSSLLAGLGVVLLIMRLEHGTPILRLRGPAHWQLLPLILLPVLYPASRAAAGVLNAQDSAWVIVLVGIVLVLRLLDLYFTPRGEVPAV